MNYRHYTTKGERKAYIRGWLIGFFGVVGMTLAAILLVVIAYWIAVRP